MIKVAIILIFILDFVGLNGQNPAEHWMKYETPEQAGFSSEKLKSVDSLYIKNGASALMVIYNGNILISKGDITRKYDCHSIRKTLISGLYGVYADKGMIDIHKSLSQLGIDEPIKLTEQEKSATIQDLLKSRSGIYIPPFGNDTVVNPMPKRGSHAPNTYFYYNNWDFNVLGAIFKKETHLDMFKAFDETIAKPLKMEDLKLNDCRFWSDSTESTIYPKYDIKMSARDLARFGTLYCNEGTWDNKQILSKKWIFESFTPYSQIDHGNYQEGYGYMWWIETIDDSITMYSGRGWGGHILTVVPKVNLVMVKRHDTYNTNGGDGWTGMYIRQIINAKVSSPKPSPKLIPLETEEPAKIDFIFLSIDQLKKYQQNIFMNGRNREIRFTESGLVFDDWFILHPVSETKFYMEDFNKYVYFKIVDNIPIFDRIE
jgi:CubicO group peptidase (beta-lactamase class C family)